MNFLHTALAFLLALGPLIVFHELGHYWVARLCGVKVLRFSIGMGKVVWSRRVGPDQTEWAISALPLGGYVKMLDARDPDIGPLSAAERAREFNAQSVWKRIAIVAAGPLANFLLAIAVMAGLYMHGVAEPAARVRVASEDTVAWSAGLRGGDLVTAINGEKVGAWSELRMGLLHAVMDHSEARIEVDRPATGQLTLTVPASALRGLDVESDVADKLGLGVWAPKPVLGRVEAGGPAAKAGLRRGDRIATIDGKAIADGIAFVETVRASPNKPLVMTGERAGQPFSVVVVPSEQDHKGRINAVVEMQPESVTVSSGPITAIGKAAAKTWDTVTLTLRMIGKMITGEVSWKNVTGPLTIADYAGQTARMGAEVFLGFIAFVSISLGVMNLLPIPVLDGGLLLYYLVEVLTGRPLPERIGEFAQRAGVGLLVTLMALAVFNDVMRLL
ncbi:RIP metalloprotease RseP [Massilia arenosa]|uniref:Zinc metalloprotease n=1 Tax=Zemynaea arenosa TaxID=2561931 RepID=A0A4Y9SGS7_9BURK|nr:RIP metalloprotease RseP [Massilia arenosa]TFW23444.1 RIP metalloprotease RseP [Massilia arenosa]